MSPSRQHDRQSSGRSNGTEDAPHPEAIPYSVGTAALRLTVPAAGRSRSWGAPIQDPFTYYKAFMSSGASSDGSTKINLPHEDSERLMDEVEGRPIQRVGCQQQGKQRAVPYHVAVRFANRSNGMPLATIVEQRSVSTLNSRESRLSVGRFSSIRSAGNTSLGLACSQPSRRSNEKALMGIGEDARHDLDIQTAARALDSEVQQGRGETWPSHGAAALAYTASYGSGGFVTSQTNEIERPTNDVGLKSFLRDALYSFRGGPGSRSGASYMANATMSHCGGERPDSPHIGPHVLECIEKVDNNPPVGQGLPVATSGRESHLNHSLSPHDGSEVQARSGKMYGYCSGSSADLSPNSNLASGFGTLSFQLPDLDLSHTEAVMDSACSVQPSLQVPCSVAHCHVLEGATTLHPRSRDVLQARDAFSAAISNRNDTSSIPEHDRARDTSRNASFCSTMSTSYSGTVLGVDLDLEHELLQPARRLDTPVWFTPKECIDSAPEPPEHHHKNNNRLLTRSITSSALSALLPIAFAEHIVHPNPKTPRISFYSPSGNLIQAEGSSALSTDTPLSHSSLPGSPSTGTSFYNHARSLTACDALSASAGLPPPRPAPVPMSTSPQSFAPLPEHLRHHHNYRHPERSQNTPESKSPSNTTIDRGYKVKGCGGVMRSKNLGSRIGTNKHSSTHAEPRAKQERTMSCIFNIGPTKGRFKILASRPISHKRNKLQKRARPSRSEGGIGEAAGHTMRICFCQPYDGAGAKTAMAGCRSSNRCRDGTVARQARDTETPNVRIVNGEGRDRSTGPGARARSDSGVSTGTSIRVCLVGA